jgi:DNA-binding Lrp family transcriptional regulator
VTVYSDADRTGLFEIRDIPCVTHVDIVLGAFDAVVTVEGEDEEAIEKAVRSISRTRGVKEAKPLVEVRASSHGSLKPVIGRRA